MTRRKRIALEILAPPVFASTLLSVMMAASERDVRMLGAVPFVLVFAYLLAGIPSVLFAIAMEVAFARGLDARSGRTVLLASGLGALSGVPIGILQRRDLDWRATCFFMLLGLATGCAIGLIIRYSAGAGARTGAGVPGRIRPWP